MTSLEKIVVLPPNISKLFYCPLQGEAQFVRTGTIGDGSCLFHSLCHAYSPEYVHMNDDQKVQLVSRLRNSMAKNMSIERWKGLNNSMISIVSFQETVNKLITNFYNVVENNKSKRSIKSTSLKKVVEHILVNSRTIDIYSSLLKIITLKNVTGGGGILEVSYRDCNCVDMCIENVIKNVEDIIYTKLQKGGLDTERVNFLTEKFKMFMKCVLNEAESSAYKKYIRNLQDSKTYVDQYQIDLIADKFNLDIYFINANNRLPYMTAATNKNNYKQRDSVIVLWIDENHYEIIGRVINGTKRVERKFKPDDTFITMLYTLHCNPTKFASKYPEYIHYLPSEVRNSFGIDSDINKYNGYVSDDSDDSDVRSDSDSDIYSD